MDGRINMIICMNIEMNDKVAILPPYYFSYLKSLQIYIIYILREYKFILGGIGLWKREYLYLATFTVSTIS